MMLPTSHDITLESLDNCLIVLKKLFESENEVLITTKPKFYCIEKICKDFIEYKDLAKKLLIKGIELWFNEKVKDNE